MGRWEIILTLATLAVMPAEGRSQSIRYPRVYGATGRPYGPTQAHYQYQKQYGRPWHGYRGLTAPPNTNAGLQFVNGYPGSHLSYGYNAYYNHGGCNLGYGGIIPSPGYPLFPGYTPPVPRVIYGYPPVLGYNPLGNRGSQLPPAANFAAPNNAPLDLTPAPNGNPLPPLASSPEAKLKSVRAEAQGDMWFQKQEYHKAFDRYKTAVAEAGDRGAAHLRLAVCYAALNHMDLAARQLKRGIAADPQFVENADDLSKIYGAGNQIAQSEMVHRAALWLKEDIRDPDRLFLLGALLHLQEDDRAAVLLETGLALRGRGEHFREFLEAAESSSNNAPEETAPVNSPQPDVVDQNSPAPPTGGLPPLPAPSDSPSTDSPSTPAPPGPAVPTPPR